MRAPTALLLALLGSTTSLPAQQHVHDPAVTAAVLDATPHLRVTPARTPTTADSARGDSLVRVARQAVDRYQSVAVAEQDGYKVRVEKMKQAKVLHYTNLANGFRARTSFDPALPTSLLYQRTANGQLQLIGVMYTMPASATLDDLDARVPLGLVQWHLHTNICLPRGRDARQSADVVGRNAKFGPHGSITTEEACTQAGGRFKAQSFGWMVHVNVMEADPWEPGQKHMHQGMD
jgi:hypothetical protein